MIRDESSNGKQKEVMGGEEEWCEVKRSDGRRRGVIGV
jgi:hypothetical protein